MIKRLLRKLETLEGKKGNPSGKAVLWLMLGLITVFSLIIYWPALTVEFGVNDDYTLLTYDQNNPTEHFLSQIVFVR